MELRHLRYFVAVAEEQHFSRAARRLNISQPPLSQQILSLEHELGLKLLDRDRHSVALTKAGEAFLHRARNILASVADARDEARQISLGQKGTLSIGFMSSVMLVRITEFLAVFGKRMPMVDVDLRQLRSDEQYMSVVNGDIDAGFVDIAVSGMAGAIKEANLHIDLALRERLILCVSPDHELAKRSAVSVSELQSVPIITLARQNFQTFFDSVLKLCQAAGFSPRVKQVESMPVAIAMAAAGFGVAIVPKLSLAAADRSGVCFVPIDEEAYTEIYLVSRRVTSPLLEQFREICSIKR